MEALIITGKSLTDLLLGVGSPSFVVKLGNVVYDVLDAANYHFACLVGHVHHVVERTENILFQHLSVLLADRVLFLALLCIHGAQILFVSIAEWSHTSRYFLLAIFGQGPVTIDNQLEVEGSLLANIRLEVLVNLDLPEERVSLLRE